MVGTFKIITTAASIEEKIIDLEKDTFHDSGSVVVGGARIGCWKAGGHGHQTFLQVLENSCNPGVNTGTYFNLKQALSFLILFLNLKSLVVSSLNFIQFINNQVYQFWTYSKCL